MLDIELKEMILSANNVRDGYRKTRLGDGKCKATSARFNMNPIYELAKLREELYLGIYRPSPYYSFMVHEPKERVIHAPGYRDKIVQHILNNVLAPFFKPLYINDSFSCIEGRGNFHAVRCLQDMMRKAKWEYGSDYRVVKADVKKFFYSIPRDIMRIILAKHINCPWLLALLFVIIDTSPGDTGLPLGNLTSQLLANVLMNELDQFCKRTLGIKYYLRYADDVFVFAPNLFTAHIWLSEIKDKTRRIGLEMHPNKSNVRSPFNGVDGLGFKVNPGLIKLKSESKKRIKTRLRKYGGLNYNNTLIVRDIEQRINGWVVHSRIGSSDLFIQHLVDKHPFIELGDNNLLKIAA